jgi:hypothetical protein
MCSDEADLSKNDKLKVILNKYFDQQLVNKEEEDIDDIKEEPVIIHFCPYFFFLLFRLSLI